MFMTLLVEDNAPFRQSLREMLCERFPRLVVEEAVDGEEALQKVESLLPHLVFMDIKLPGANGLEITREIKERYSTIQVIILTSYDFPEYREAAAQYGADHFLSKESASREDILALVDTIYSEEDEMDGG
ncbi:MAG: response regulator transcription factor [Deltaproteobacteria bacterium]|nr:response regulator transcription factor [Deltaproteobacteria bacterium]